MKSNLIFAAMMLVYLGNRLPMLMDFAGLGTPPVDILNLKYITS